MSSASSPSTKGGGEMSVIWLRERNKEIEEDSIRMRTISVSCEKNKEIEEDSIRRRTISV